MVGATSTGPLVQGFVVHAAHDGNCARHLAVLVEHLGVCPASGPHQDGVWVVGWGLGVAHHLTHHGRTALLFWKHQLHSGMIQCGIKDDTRFRDVGLLLLLL